MIGRDATVVVSDLVKVYPKNPVPAVDQISFSVESGEVFGLLGPNGAGKTTTIGVLTTRIRPTSGRALVAGVDVVADPVGARRRVAVVPQRNNMDRSLSIRQNLLFHASYHGVGLSERNRRADELLEQFGLSERAGERVDMFSGGQSQRAMIARALMHHPNVLFLDEPSSGLDPAARLFVWDRIRALQADGVTVILTTHDMDEAQSLSNRVAIMDHGHVLALDDPDALTRSLPGTSALELTVEADYEQIRRGVDGLGALQGVERVEQSDVAAATGIRSTDDRSHVDKLHLYLTREAPEMLGPVARLLDDCGVVLSDVRLGTPSLEDVFIALTGRSLR